MSVKTDIMMLEDRLRQAELKPDPTFFEEFLDNEALLDGQKLKIKVVEAHRPGGTAKFKRVDMYDFQITEHGPTAAVVTCKGTYENAKGVFTLKFMRVWLKKDNHWRIVAGTTAPI